MIRKTKAVKQRDLLSGFLCLRMAERYLGKSDLLCWIDSKKVFFVLLVAEEYLFVL